MASLATCPLCAKQLAIPKEASSDDRAQCPECDATFLLSNALMVDLPIARLLEPLDTALPENDAVEIASPCVASPSAASPSAASPGVASPGVASPDVASPDVESQSPDEASKVESLASWETRLKKAIEHDTAELTEPVESDEPQPPLSSRPEFEFQLDPTPAELPGEAEKESAKEIAKVELLATESAQSFAQELETSAVAIAPAATEVAPATEKPQIESNEAEVRPSPAPVRRARGTSPLKVAAFLIGPGVMGIFLGLYALLWIIGPRGDLLNLAQYLPPAMLPAMDGHDEMAAPADEGQLLANDPPVDEPPPLETPRLETPPLETKSVEPRKDDAVRLATDQQPVPPPTNRLPAEFSDLFAAAHTAASGFFEGDLSTNEAVSRKGQTYMTICQLAEQFELILLPNLDAMSQAEVGLAKEFFDSMAAETTATGDWASITSRWWGYESRPNQGIFFVGQIQNVQPLGSQTLCYVALDEPATATVIPVLLEQPPSGGSDRIVVVGKIVSNPRNNLQGFTLDLPQVVVAPYSRVLQP